MKPRFTQLMIEQHQAIAALETAMEQLFDTEKALIEENPKLPAVERVRGRAAALELVHLVVDQKIKSLAAESAEPVASLPASDQPVS